METNSFSSPCRKTAAENNMINCRTQNISLTKKQKHAAVFLGVALKVKSRKCNQQMQSVSSLKVLWLYVQNRKGNRKQGNHADTQETEPSQNTQIHQQVSQIILNHVWFTCFEMFFYFAKKERRPQTLCVQIMTCTFSLEFLSCNYLTLQCLCLVMATDAITDWDNRRKTVASLLTNLYINTALLREDENFILRGSWMQFQVAAQLSCPSCSSSGQKHSSGIFGWHWKRVSGV